MPVVFSDRDLHHVPIILNGHDKYVIEDNLSFTELCYRLRKQPTIAIPDFTRAKLQPPPEPKFLSHEPPPVVLNVGELQEPDTSPTKESEVTHAIDAVALESEQGVDYRNLRDLLKAGEWREADKETLKVMLKAANRESEGWLDDDSLRNFPCKDLRTINRLWVTASNGHFGFSVQKKIWEECGSPTTYYNLGWDKFGTRVGWRRKRNWLYDKELEFSIDFSPVGELPCNLRGTSMGARVGGTGTGVRVERWSSFTLGSISKEYVVVVSLFSRKDL
ncbi:hypothetical protein C7B64_07320 [Merismopedia glauca CCAP 1448/3]|uniref:GUN4-like domain-containing protein n=1 Tax=Merismopedia glauca CCAP 1448/3 TaxID=1296344 RepID=A0A2T1C6F7_9CYAN|nr:hypothetical protein C7B64_07320 [Merismopedia glauca CCAP 1448/3]